MTREDAHEVYDRMAASYAETNPDQPARAGYEWPSVREALPDLAGKRVLDAGCGSGHYSAWLAERGASVVGIDASEAMVGEARERHGDAAEFRVADLRDPLPFADGAFDLVVSQLTLEHLRDWDPVVAEFARVLSAGGEVVASLDHPFTTYFVIDHEPSEIGSATAEAADYYEIERYERDWGEVTMPAHRRPLREVVRPFVEAGFALTDLREPRPGTGVEHHEYFEEHTPRFLIIRATKR
jgi:SAM-dependent methyltransferase